MKKISECYEELINVPNFQDSYTFLVHNDLATICCKNNKEIRFWRYSNLMTCDLSYPQQYKRKK